MRRERLLRAAAPFAGPALIVAAVLVVDHAFAFGGKLTNQHEDVLGLTLPTYCFLGKSLAAGHIPLWNPYSLAGLPFAADPQSGWTYVPAMLLFSTLSCASAMRWYVVLQPVLAGLGIYWFLRSERVGRPAATVGGLTLALAMAASYIGLSIAIAAALAWTALLLAAASRYWRAETWPSRLGWLAVTALAGGQLAAAYASDGLAYGIGALAAYVVVRVIGDLQAGRSWRLVLGLAGMLAVMGPLVNMAYLVPRFGYLSRATVGLGYAHLVQLQSRLTGLPSPVYRAKGVPPQWPLGFTVSPGSYVAVAALVLTGAAFFTRRRRGLTLAFGVIGLASWLLSTEMFAGWAREHLPRVPLVDFYLHDPRRFRYTVVFGAAVLAGLGLQAFLEARSTRERALMLAPGAVAFLALPLVFDVPGGHSGVWVFGLLAGGGAVATAGWRPALALAVPAVVAVELVAGGLSGQSVPYERAGLGLAVQDPGAFPGLRRPAIDAGAYTTPDAIARRMLAEGGGRFVTFDPPLIHARDGYLPLQTPEYWNLEANGRGMLFGLEDIGGYNSVAPIPYWAYSRVADPHPTRYNVTFYRHLTPQILDLLDVRFVAGVFRKAPVPGLEEVMADGDVTLYRVTPASLALVDTGQREPQRSTFVADWNVVPTAQDAREASAAGGLDPRAEVELQEDPELGSPTAAAEGGTAEFDSTGNQSARVAVQAPTAGIVLIRIPWDPHWTATVDGEPVEVLKADGFLLAVAVQQGSHEVVIAYRNGSIGIGLILTLLFLAAILAPAVVGRFRASRKQPRASSQAARSSSE